MSSPEIPNLPEVLLIMNAEVCLLCTEWNVRWAGGHAGYWLLDITKGKEYIHTTKCVMLCV